MKQKEVIKYFFKVTSNPFEWLLLIILLLFLCIGFWTHNIATIIISLFLIFIEKSIIPRLRRSPKWAKDFKKEEEKIVNKVFDFSQETPYLFIGGFISFLFVLASCWRNSFHGIIFFGFFLIFFFIISLKKAFQKLAEDLDLSLS